MGKLKSIDLVRTMKKDLLQLHTDFPLMKIVYSSIVQRINWRHPSNPAKINKARIWVNIVMTSFVRLLGGAIIRHTQIKFNRPSQCLRDGVHLSRQGNDIFK